VSSGERREKKLRLVREEGRNTKPFKEEVCADAVIFALAFDGRKEEGRDSSSPLSGKKR